MAPLPPSKSVGPSRPAQLLCGAHEARQPARGNSAQGRTDDAPLTPFAQWPDSPEPTCSCRTARPSILCSPTPSNPAAPCTGATASGEPARTKDGFERTSGRPQDTLTRLEPSPRPCREGNPESLWRPGSAHGPRHTDRIAAGQQSSVALARRVRGLVHSSAPAA